MRRLLALLAVAGFVIALPFSHQAIAKVKKKPVKKKPLKKFVEVCHTTGGTAKTLTIPVEALDAHLAHGDTLEACE